MSCHYLQNITKKFQLSHLNEFNIFISNHVVFERQCLMRLHIIWNYFADLDLVLIIDVLPVNRIQHSHAY